MIGDGIRAARVRARYSPLIGLTWEPVNFQLNIRSAIKNATTRLSPHRGGRRPPGRHAAPGRPVPGRHAAH